MIRFIRNIIRKHTWTAEMWALEPLMGNIYYIKGKKDIIVVFDCNGNFLRIASDGNIVNCDAIMDCIIPLQITRNNARLLLNILKNVVSVLRQWSFTVDRLLYTLSLDNEIISKKTHGLVIVRHSRFTNNRSMTWHYVNDFYIGRTDDEWWKTSYHAADKIVKNSYKHFSAHVSNSHNFWWYFTCNDFRFIAQKWCQKQLEYGQAKRLALRFLEGKLHL